MHFKRENMKREEEEDNTHSAMRDEMEHSIRLSYNLRFPLAHSGLYESTLECVYLTILLYLAIIILTIYVLSSLPSHRFIHYPSKYIEIYM